MVAMATRMTSNGSRMNSSTTVDTPGEDGRRRGVRGVRGVRGSGEEGGRVRGGGE